MAQYTKASKVLLSIAILAGIFSVGGGGLAIPPFRYLDWLNSDLYTIGIYGSCSNAPVNWSPSDAWQYWENYQNNICTSIFNPPQTDGSLKFAESITIFSIMAACVIMKLFAVFSCGNSGEYRQMPSGMYWAFLSFLTGTAGLGYAVSVISGIQKDWAQGIWNETPVDPVVSKFGKQPEFLNLGNGVYCFSGALMLTLVSACLLLKDRREKRNFQYYQL